MRSYWKTNNKGWNRTTIRVKGDKYSTMLNGKDGFPEAKMAKLPGRTSQADGGIPPIQFRNVFIRELKAGTNDDSPLAGSWDVPGCHEL